MRWIVGGLEFEGAQRQRLKVLHDGGEVELVACAGKSSEPHAFEAMMNFEMCKPHLDALALVA